VDAGSGTVSNAVRMTEQTRKFLPLEPCPFCRGGELELQQELALWKVACHECYAEGPGKFTAQLAAEAWNVRKP